MTNLEIEKLDRLIEKLNRELGNFILSALNDDDVIEIILNADSEIWLDTFSKGMFPSGHYIEEMRAHNIISTVAAIRNKVINQKEPSLECTLPIDGSRFTALIPEVVEKPTFNIRKRALEIYSLEQYVDENIITEAQASILREQILNNKSIIVVGGPGTGKTTFANALLREMVTLGNPHQRFVIIEDKPELQCLAKNKLQTLVTSHFSYINALHFALVSRPDKICVGECRGGEILTLLKAWNTGTKGGISTIHSNDAHSAISRIEGMIEENAGIKSQPSLIVDAIDVICSLSFNKITGRKLNSIVQVEGYDKHEHKFILKNLT